MSPVYHIGPNGCSGIAFFYTALAMHVGDALTIHNCQKVDGTPFELGEILRCGRCGTVMMPDTRVMSLTPPDRVNSSAPPPAP